MAQSADAESLAKSLVASSGQLLDKAAKESSK